MQEAAAALQATRAEPPRHLGLGGTIKLPKKLPLPRPPKSPKRYSSASSRSSAFPIGSLPQTPLYSSHSAASDNASCSTSPTTESYFDALSLQPASPRDRPSSSSQQQRSPIAEASSQLPPSFERRDSQASSSCVSDQELASLAYVQRQTERRTSLVPLPSPDAPHSQRRRHRRRPPSSASGLSSSQASLSSAAGSIHASETDSQGDERPSSPVREGQENALRWWHSQLETQRQFPTSATVASTQARSSVEHPYTARDSHASTSTSAFSRTRSSQATNLGPFDLDDDSPSADARRQERQLQRELFDSIGRPSSSRSDASSSRLSMPTTPFSFSTTTHDQQSPRTSLRSLDPDSQDDYLPESEASAAPDWRVPIVRNPPVKSPSAGTRSYSTSPASGSSSTAHHSHSVTPRIPIEEDYLQVAPTSRRTSASTTTRRRVGRIYSTSTVTYESNADELRTPRVSVSNQGRLSDSVYSVAGTAPDTFPYMPDTSKDLPAPPFEHDRRTSLGLGLSTDTARRPSLQQQVLAEDDERDEDVFKLPRGSHSGAQRGSVVSSVTSPTGHSEGRESPTSTSYRNSFHESVNSLASSLDLAPATPSIELTEDERKQNKRARIIQELVQTEEDFARDMALVRDVWLARARGKEMGEIIARLETYLSSTSRPTSVSSSNLGIHRLGAGQIPEIRLVERKSSAPQMMERNSSQNSFRSLKGMVNNLSKPDKEKTSNLSNTDSGTRNASQGGFSRYRSLSNAQPLPPGAALYAPLRQADTDVIFGNIEAVASLSEQFAAILREEQNAEELDGSEADIGQAFLTMLPRLSSTYSTYCAPFGDAVQRWESIADSLASYSQDCKDLCYGHTNAWDLPSLLIKPVQRCLKYPLFIQSLLECTPDSHPDKPSLQQSSVAMLQVAESINEMKRRHEIVTKLIKRKARPGLYGNTRRGSDKAVPSAAKTPSGGSFKSSLSRKFKRSSKIGLTDTTPPSAVPEPDEEFESLLSQLETKHRLVQSFILDSKSWSKSVRAAMVALLQLSLAWKGVSSLLGQDDSRDAAQSSRTIDHFAVDIVRSAIEDQWRDMDQEIRKALVPKATQLLELFSSPRSAIATRYHRYNESRSKASSKDHALLTEHALAYHALNAQLKEELPLFLKGIDKIFIAVVQRFITLQVAFNERMTDAWREYIQVCCTQLGPHDQGSNESVAQWWQAHSALAAQLDSLKILAADKVIEDIERRQRDSLPPGLRPRQSGDRTSLPSTRQSRKSLPGSSVCTETESGSTIVRPPSSSQLPSNFSRTSRSNQAPGNPVNRHSTFSSKSAGSLSFSGHSSSSATSPPTPSPGYGAVATSFRPRGQEKALKGFSFLSCEPGDLFEVLDEVAGEKHLLVRHEGLYGDVGWLPAHLLHRLE